jgi:hypothetical protein
MPDGNPTMGIGKSVVADPCKQFTAESLRLGCAGFVRIFFPVLSEMAFAHIDPVLNQNENERRTLFQTHSIRYRGKRCPILFEAPIYYLLQRSMTLRIIYNEEMLQTSHRVYCKKS